MQFSPQLHPLYLMHPCYTQDPKLHRYTVKQKTNRHLLHFEIFLYSSLVFQIYKMI